MDNQEQVSRRFVDSGAISLYLWSYMILFQVNIWSGNSWQAIGFVTTWLAKFKVRCPVFPKQCDLKPLDEEIEENMQKISAIVHIWLKIKKERTSEKGMIWFFLIW